MAKINSLFEISGTMGNITFVKSKAYGNHFRRKRGTNKPAVVNDSFRESSAELKASTPFAKLIKDSFNPYLFNFKDGTLWTRLRSFFRKQLRANSQVDYKELNDFQFHKEHSLNSLLQGKVGISAAVTEEELSITLELRGHPYFPVHYINAYCLTLAVAAISADSTTTQTWDHMFPVTMLTDKEIGQRVLCFPVSKEMKTFIICLKCDGYKDAVIMNNVRTKGMAILKVVERN
jgi:hypothetical protein